MKILLIGCGGIGSWLSHFIAKGIAHAQLPLSNSDVTVADGDIVEIDNLPHQNFSPHDIGYNKAKVIATRYGFKAIPRYINTEDDNLLQTHNIVLLCVDNNTTRKYIYGFSDKYGYHWIDGRVEDSKVIVFQKSPQNTYENMVKFSLSEERKSCQSVQSKATNNYHYGNIVAASIMFQLLVNYVRGKKSSDRILVVI